MENVILVIGLALVFLIFYGMSGENFSLVLACVIAIVGMALSYQLGMKVCEEKFLSGEIKIENKTITVPTIIGKKN